MLAKKILFSAMMANRPGPANAMFAEVVPKKILPMRVPAEFHTYDKFGEQRTENV